MWQYEYNEVALIKRFIYYLVTQTSNDNLTVARLSLWLSAANTMNINYQRLCIISIIVNVNLVQTSI